MAALSVIWKGTTSLVAQPQSGAITAADRITQKDIYKGPAWLCKASMLRRGTYGTGARLGWVVTSSGVEPEAKGIGTLTINWEVGGAAAPYWLLPLDEFDVQPVDLNPKVERHPVFHGPTWPGNPEDGIGLTTLSYCYTAIHGATAELRKSAIQAVSNIHDASQKAWGLKLLSLLQQGVETYYLAGIRYTWVWYSFVVPRTTLGGFIQAPLGPMYGMFDSSINWLRQSDLIQSAGVNGSVFKITSTWIGGHRGLWSLDLYAVA